MALTLTKNKNKIPKKKPRAVTPFVPALPRVNMLSAALQERAAVRRLKQRFVAAGVATLVIAAGVFAGEQGMIASAQSSLDQATAENQTLNAQKQGLQKVAAFYAEVTKNEQTIQSTMSKEVLYDQTLVALAQAAPNGVVIGNVAMVVDTAPPTAAAASARASSGATVTGATCPGPDPFTKTTSVGCITLTGQAVTRDAVGTLVHNLNADDRFVNAFVSSTTVDQHGAVTFNATVGLTSKVYSGRYKDVKFLQEAGQ